MADKIQMLYGPKENLKNITAGTFGRLFFTVVTPENDQEGKPEGHIYFDNGKEIVHLYDTELTALEDKIKAVDAVVKSLTGDESDDSIADMIEKAIKQLNLEDLYTNKYEFGSLLNARITNIGKEYRITFPSNTEWVEQSSNNDKHDGNKFYISMKAYAPKGAVKFKEDTKKKIEDPTVFDFKDEFAGTDKYGRNYSIIWLPVASKEDGDWTYFGDQSKDGKYVGWYYTVEWYDGNENVIATDQIKINLDNDKNDITLLPSYMNDYAKKSDLQDVSSEWTPF